MRSEREREGELRNRLTEGERPGAVDPELVSEGGVERAGERCNPEYG